MWDLDYEENRALKNWCFWTVVLEKTLESPSDCKEIQPVHPKGNQFWIFIGRTDVEAETPILWPPGAKNWLIWKDPDTGKDKAGGKGDNRGWNGWMASPTWWTWVWASSRSWWRTGKPGVLQSVASQRVGHDWATELNVKVCVLNNFAWNYRYTFFFMTDFPQYWLILKYKIKSKKMYMGFIWTWLNLEKLKLRGWLLIHLIQWDICLVL